jgi:hypothetical protein
MLVVGALAVVAPAAGFPLSTTTDVTPANIASQPLTFRVEHEMYDNDAFIVFKIYASAGKRKMTPSREGRFVVWKEKVVIRSGRIHASSTRPTELVVCNVQERDKGGVLCYQVQVSRELLDRSTFTFRAWEPNGMPAFDEYEMILGEFVR